MSMRPPHAKLVVRRARILAPLIALPLAVGCANQAADGLSANGVGQNASSHDGMAGMGGAKEAKVMNMSQLADAIGCGKPTIQVNASDIKTGYCNVKKQRYFLNVFPSKEGLNSWADEEQGWGSVLIGNQWAIGVAPETLLPKLQKKLGGIIKGEHAMANDGAEQQAADSASTDTSGSGGY
jgi:hypothetical protein